MRLLTFSFLKSCRPKLIYQDAIRTLKLKPDVMLPKTTGDPNLISIAPTWPVDLEPELRASMEKDMVVIPDFISEQEENAMVTELEPQLKRMRYEFDHWDNAIHGFRETERTHWSDIGEAVLARVRAVAFAPGTGAGQPLPHAHVLDLAPSGHIKPHVDAVRFCGEVIAGLCLVSTAVMRLEHSTNKLLVLDALLKQRALYIMRGAARYSFTHAVQGGEASKFCGASVPRLRRIAVICRSKPAPALPPTIDTDQPPTTITDPPPAAISDQPPTTGIHPPRDS